MTHEKSIVERAFEIAQSGGCKNVPALRKALKNDGYPWGLIEMHLTSSKLRKQLGVICQIAHSEKTSFSGCDN